MTEPKLCYVKLPWCYFAIGDAWGDDWDDRPYECNAGDPYEYDTVIAINSSLVTPDEFCNQLNSPYSVEDINNGKVPWLQSGDIKIMAGTPLSEFIEIIESINGDVFTIGGN